jgi:prepilin-type N-terminal cleavage/methylation domain-containing protein
MANINTHQRQGGFTLVEIAIVLVIIGLLLGGILKGQEMITQARIKNVINDFNGITAAYFAYQDRYKAIPGDDFTSATRWTTGTLTVFGGDGNGSVAGTYGAAPAAPAAGTVETLKYWWHLRLAGFVPGATAGQAAVTQPSNAVGGIVGVEASPFGLTGLAICSANVPDKIAGAVDTQLDDQNPGTGGLRSREQAGAANPAVASLATVPPSYQETGSNQYLLCRAI